MTEVSYMNIKNKYSHSKKYTVQADNKKQMSNDAI